MFSSSGGNPFGRKVQPLLQASAGRLRYKHTVLGAIAVVAPFRDLIGTGGSLRLNYSKIKCYIAVQLAGLFVLLA